MNNKFMILGLLGIILFTVIIIETSDRTFAQTTATELERGTLKDYELIKPRKPVQPLIYLKSRVVTPGVGIDPEVRKRLEALPLDRFHVLLYLDHIPDTEERARLSKIGISLLSYIPNNGWIASVPKERLEEIAKTPPVRWIGEILPGDKLGPTVKTQKFGNWSYDPATGYVKLTVMFFKDVSLDDAAKSISIFKGKELARARITNPYLIINLQKNSILQLAAEDSVKWINEYPPPPTDTLNESRPAIGVDTVQAAPYNLNGTNIKLGQWETWNPDNITQSDLMGRLTIGEDVGISDHATHVAGIVLGNGNLSNGNKRGMAPNATIVSYRYWNDVTEIQTKYTDAIDTYGINISTNSWGFFDLAGTYDERGAEIDAVVKGNITKPLPIVHAAGNDRAWGYTSLRIPASSKNVITVGGTNSNDNSVYVSSSMGPTSDNRTKPDVVAPGCQIGGDTGINSTLPGDTYGVKCGTSMATPHVSGTIALILEEYANNHNNPPLPSTVKAILIQTAHDLDRNGNGSETNDGPDYTNGWGIINATSAVNLIINDIEGAPRIIENMINDRETDYYNITVPANTQELTVTLVWDDEPGDVLAAKYLQNDLDLFLIDPLGGIHLPWILNESNSSQAAYKGIDDRNNVEKVRAYDAAGLQTGVWKVIVNGSQIPYPKQFYSLTASHSFSQPIHAIVILLDTSGSMNRDPDGTYGVPEEQTRIYKAKQASNYSIELLNLYKKDVTKIGVVTFPAHPDACPSSDIVYPLNDLDDATKITAQTEIDSMVASGGTPMAHGIETAQNMLNFDASDRNIILLSDGYHNCPSNDFPLELVNQTPIKIYTLAYGHSGEVDHDLLRDISNESGAGEEGEGFYVAENTTLVDLVPVFKSIIADMMGLYSPIDPAVSINQEETKNHSVSITELDDKISFSLSWGDANFASSQQPPLQLKIITPGGLVIDPTITSSIQDIDYISGNAYQIYHIQGDYLAGKTGTWQMQVDANNLQDMQTVYHYSVIMESDLGMDVSFDKSNYGTGDSMLIQASILENKWPASLDKLTVKVRRPDEGPGNWYAKNKATVDEMKKIPMEKDGEILPDVYRKYLALTKILDVPYPSTYSETTLILYDDGKHGDGKARDGVYANYLRGIEKEGIYTFSLFAEGRTSKNNLYTRDRIIKKYVTVNVDPGSSIAEAKLVKTLENGFAQYEVTLVPMDSLGNYLGPGYSRLISFKTQEGELIGGLVDNLDGSYTQSLKIDTAKTEAVTINIKGVEIKQEIKPEIPLPTEKPSGPEPTPSWLKWLVLLIIILILIMLLWWRFKT